MRWGIVMMAAALLLSGCALRSESWGGKVTCLAGRDCQIKMGRAYEFINTHALVEPKVANSTSIRTRNTRDESIFLEYNVHRIAVDQQNDVIEINVMCGRWGGCMGDPHVLADALLMCVNGKLDCDVQ